MSSPRRTVGIASAVLVAAVLGLGFAVGFPAAATEAEVEQIPTGVEPGAQVVGSPVDLVGEPLDLFGEIASMYGEIDGLTVVEGPDGTEVRTAADVLFEFDSAELSAEAQALLDEVAEVLAAASPDAVVVEGHTDGIGTAAYNDRLSLERAQSVVSHLEQVGGLSSISFDPVGKGANEPIAAETDDDGEDLPEGRARNRRVTLRFED